MAKFKTKGIIVKIGLTAAPTTPLPQLGDCTYDNGERDALINATTHDTTGGIHEFLDPGFRSPPSFSGEMLYDPANVVQEVVRAAHVSGATVYVNLTRPDTGAATTEFPARVKTLSEPFPVMGKMMMNFVFEGLSAETFTP
jgi:hypothetical protein